MSLFVGNISKNVRKSDLVDEFEKFGKCDINHKVLTPNTSPLSYTYIFFGFPGT